MGLEIGGLLGLIWLIIVIWAIIKSGLSSKLTLLDIKSEETALGSDLVIDVYWLVAAFSVVLWRLLV